MPETRAPGRVNLIGDHTDYNDGFVLPLAIDLECRVRFEPRRDVVRARSRERGTSVEVAADGSGDAGDDWGRYVAAVLQVLAARGRPAAGFDAEITSTVPVGAGLSSSAALEIAVALAACDVASFDLPTDELARACRDAEEVATGVPCGIMDQLASLAGRRDCALLIDCRSLEIRHVPIPPELAVLVVHSGLPRALADTAYADRRRACEAAARRIGAPALRDATPSQVADDPRARHVVSENQRVLDAARALERCDLAELGRLLGESHASLRDDFDVSTPELDMLVEALVAAGAVGARLTGAGFGGCVVALAPAADADDVLARATEQYAKETGLAPTPYRVRAADGAGYPPAR